MLQDQDRTSNSTADVSANAAAAGSAVTITNDQKRQLDEEGYFVTPKLFDDDTLAAVREAFAKLWAEDIERSKSQDELAQLLAQFRPFMCRLEHRDDTCAAFCRHPVFLELCRQLLGPDADRTWNQAILKPALDASGVRGEHASLIDNAFAFHQDNWYAEKGQYAKDSDMKMLTDMHCGFTTWVAISPTTVENGTLFVLPRHHRDGLLPHEWSDERREWVGQYDTKAAVPAIMEPGQMLVFRKYTPHGSGKNTSAQTRMAYQIAFSRPGLKLKPSPDLSPVLRDGQSVDGQP